jgi:hypothetical protein
MAGTNREVVSLVLKYCRAGGSSKGIREYLSSPKFLDYVKQNPAVTFSVEARNSRHPVLIGEYGEIRTRMLTYF